MFRQKMIPVHIQGNSLTGFLTRGSIVLDGQVPQGDIRGVNHQGGCAESPTFYTIRQDLCGSVTKNDFGLFYTGAFNDGVAAMQR